MGEGGGAACELRGVLAALRRVSRRLLFADLECESETVELVFKEGACAALPELRLRLRPGDSIAVCGSREAHGAHGDGALLVYDATLLSAWRVAHPDEAFVPRPAAPRAQRDSRGDVPASGGSAAADAPICKFFLNTGRCALGDRCARRHDAGAGADKQAYVAARRAGRAVLAAACGDPHAAGGAPAKRQRAAAFAAWLVRTHGAAALRRGAGVLDVAGGGAGGVAFELHCRWGIPTTVVDPRPPHLTRAQRAWLTAAGVDASQPGALPAHVPILFEPATWQRFAGAAAIVGMHPDQATEGIVDAASAFRCPFAVVPCCVFPTLFAARRLGPDGRRVTTREDLVAFLAAKAPGSRVTWLPFQGANQVVHTLPEGSHDHAAGVRHSAAPPWWDERAAAREAAAPLPPPPRAHARG